MTEEINAILSYYRAKILNAGGYIDPSITAVLDYADTKGPFRLEGGGRLFVPASVCIPKHKAPRSLWARLYVLSGQTDQVTPDFFRPENRVTFTMYGLAPWIDFANHSDDAEGFHYHSGGIEITAPEVNYGYKYG